MAQNGNHLCRLCGRTFTFSSNLRRHIRKMHLQSPSKVNIAFQPTININPAESDKITGIHLLLGIFAGSFSRQKLASGDESFFWISRTSSDN